MAPFRVRPDLAQLAPGIVLRKLFDAFYESDFRDPMEFVVGIDSNGHNIDVRKAYHFCDGLAEFLIDEYDGIVLLTPDDQYRFIMRWAVDGDVSEFFIPRCVVDEVMVEFRDGIMGIC
jgi:hypothetical protein